MLGSCSPLRANASRFRVVNYVGLKTPEAVALNKQYTLPTLGRDRARAVAALAIRKNARYLVSLSQDPPTTKLPEQLTKMRWALDEMRGTGLYRVYRLHSPGEN